MGEDVMLVRVVMVVVECGSSGWCDGVIIA